jgi:hypothetical protein
MERKKSFFNLLQLKIHVGIQFILQCAFLLWVILFYHTAELSYFRYSPPGAQQAEMVAEASVASIQRESLLSA